MEQQTIFKVGDKVHDARFGEGIVYDILEYNTRYPIRVKFESEKEGYTINGFDSESNLIPSLSFTPYDFINGGFSQERPIVLPKRGQLVWVKDTRSIWGLRYYSCPEGDGKAIRCFDSQQTSGPTTAWDTWSLECPLPKQINID